jgi:hypothetical protein
MLGITLVPALRSTFNQQSQINGLRERIAQQRETVAALQQEQRRWADPAYVEQQARERLKLVRVGERSFTVIDGPDASVLAGGTGAQIVVPARTSAANIPWYGQLWASVKLADTPADAATGRSSTSPASVPPAP